MDMNDLEAAALIRVVMQGSNPMKNPFNPWAGLCGDDFGGKWTAYPFQWDNEFCTQLLYFVDKH